MLNFNQFREANEKKEVVQTSNPILSQNDNIGNNASNNQTEDRVISDNPTIKVIPNGAVAIKFAVAGLIGAGIAFSVGRININRLKQEIYRLSNTYTASALQDTLSKLYKAQDDLTEALSNNKTNAEIIDNLKKKIDKLSGEIIEINALPEDVVERVNAKTKKYEDLISTVVSIYDDVEPPKAKDVYHGYFSKLFDFKKITLQDSGILKKNSFVQDMIEKFRQTGSFCLELNPKASTSEQIQSALINDRSISKIGQTLDTSLTVNYGNKVNWSDKKVARDILQNFYDGNNHTLDGIGLSVFRLDNGDYRVKIEGNGVFDYEKLTLLGNSTKVSDPYDAGGFGEGAKVALANLLAKNHSKSVKYGSANWELVYGARDGVITSTLLKKDQILDGNFIEFDTPNKELIEKLLEAFSFFKHSKNPDFQELAFENPDFGFRVLKHGEKGNFYITQRFEFENPEAWEGNVDGLNLIFKRKPDEKLYKSISGHEFNVGRDRSEMTAKDVNNLVRCFAKNMSDDEIIDAILSTQHHWNELKVRDDNALTNFISALTHEAKKRQIGIDFKDLKICCLEGRESDTILKYVEENGYTVVCSVNCGFGNIGMPSVRDVAASLSSHKALKPTQSEAKKMKILEEATGVIQKHFESTYVSKVKSIFSKLSPQDLKLGQKDSMINFNLTSLKELGCIPEDMVLPKPWDDIGLSSFDIDMVNKMIPEFFEKKINELSVDNLNDPYNEKLIDTLISIIRSSENNKELNKQYITQLSNLQIISKHDVTAPRFIFDRKNEISNSTLAEAVIEKFDNDPYKGHWVDRNYLNKGGFFELLSTWIHEICHKSGGDGTPEFTYKLTDIIESLLESTSDSAQYQTDLLALQKAFESIK